MIQIPNLKIPDWDTTQFDGGVDTPNGLHRYETTFSEDFDVPIHLFSSDQFRMFEFKVRNCQRGRSHDWTECPYAHPGEKARRRDPRKYHYSGTPCPEFRKGNCNKGDSCKFSHGVFECWLHPSRYRTQLCKDGTSCRRRVCFFAHTNEQLRFLSHTESFLSSPTSVLNSSSLSDSPTGNGVVPFGKLSVGQIVGSMRNVKLDDGPSGSPRVFGSPRGGFLSTTTTTTTLFGSAEEPIMERVESGKDLRAKIYAKLRKENFNNAASFSAPIPDIGWVSELVK